MVRKVSLTAKTMGISAPVIARGVNPHEAIRQSALTLDGPALDTALEAHDLVIADAAPNGIPAFRTIPVHAANSADDPMVKYAKELGLELEGDSVEATLKDFVAKFRSRFGIVWYGSEQAEMNLLSKIYDGEAIECEFNNIVMLHDVYIKKVILPLVGDISADIVPGSALRLVATTTGITVNGTTYPAGTVFLSAYTGETVPEVYGTTPICVEVPGSMLLKAEAVTDNAGNVHTVVDFVC